MTDGITEFEERVEKAARLAEIEYERYVYFCFNCSSISSMDDKTRHQHYCHKCKIMFSQTEKHVEPDGIIRQGLKWGMVFVDGGVHDKYTRLIKDDHARSLIAHMEIPLFVLRNAEVGKPRHITKQKHEEYIPSSPMVISVTRQMNLSAVLLGFRYLIDHGDLYRKIVSAEKEIVGLGASQKKWVR